MPPHRRRDRTDQGTSARALSAMADAARRARDGDGGVQEPSTAARRQHPDRPATEEGEPRSHVTTSPDPVPVTPPAAAPQVGVPAPPPAVPPSLQPPPPPSSLPGVPVLVFDALGDEPVGAGPRLLPVEPPRPGSRTAGATAAPAPGRHRHAAQQAPDTERVLRRAVVGVSAALVMVLAALVGSELAGGGPPPAAPLAHRSSVRALQPSSTAPAASPTTPTTTAAAASVPTPPPTSGTATTVPSPPPTPGGPPVLASLQPSSGTAGQSVVVSGSGFLSPSGRIGATVGGQTASVSCPDQTTCTVTIPSQAATAATAPVVIVTDGGSSNPLTFTLG